MHNDDDSVSKSTTETHRLFDVRVCLMPDFAGPTSRDHRVQRVDKRRNSARFPLYLAAGRVLSNPPIIVAP
jgi:hypothetical protein